MTNKEKFGFIAIGVTILGGIVMLWNDTIGFAIWTFGLGLTQGWAASEFGDKNEPR